MHSIPSKFPNIWRKFPPMFFISVQYTRRGIDPPALRVSKDDRKHGVRTHLKVLLCCGKLEMLVLLHNRTDVLCSSGHGIRPQRTKHRESEQRMQKRIWNVEWPLKLFRKEVKIFSTDKSSLSGFFLVVFVVVYFSNCTRLSKAAFPRFFNGVLDTLHTYKVWALPGCD